METARDQFTCLWCATSFSRRSPRGRKPCYCTRTCRQRAYEARRRGRLVTGHPAAPPPVPVPPRRATYEAGRRYHLHHALRPDGLPDRTGLRVTLCGTYAGPVRPSFEEPGARTRQCHVCRAIANRHPPPRAIDPGRDVAILTNLASRLRADLATGADLRQTALALVGFCWPRQLEAWTRAA